MATQIAFGRGSIIIAEMQEFGSFGAEAQYYIRRALDAAFAPALAVDRWARSDDEAAAIRGQTKLYRLLPQIRGAIPRAGVMASSDEFLFPLMTASVFDLSGGRLTGFAPYRFLYERLLGAEIRPWLPSAFAAAAAMPHMMPSRRRALLASMGSALTDRWSTAEPAFIPEWLAA